VNLLYCISLHFKLYFTVILDVNFITEHDIVVYLLLFFRFKIDEADVVVCQGMSLHWCMQPDVGLPQPDAVVFLSLDTDAAVNRAAYGNERYENVAFQRRVADIFKQLKSPYWKVCAVVLLHCGGI